MISQDISRLLGFNGEKSLAKLMSILSFAYTYHYLNWFSKTRIIGWHKMKKPLLALVIIIYVGSLVIYGIYYLLGFKVLLFLSLLHVVLEFPLNALTIKQIAKQTYSKAKG
jgi:hypothetical protein